MTSASEEPPPDADPAANRPSEREVAAAIDVIRRQLATGSEVVDADLADEPLDDPQTTVALMAQLTSGPMPSAREMAGYKAVDPSLPARIASGADDERHHRHEIENRQSKADAFASSAGVIGGWFCTIAMIALAAYAVSQDQPGLAVGAIIGALAPVAIALVNRGK